MNSMMPDPAILAMQAKDSEWLQKEMETRRLQKELGGSKTKDQKLREATKGFESIFINKLWQQMRKTVPKEGYLHGKNEEMYLSMFDQALSEKLADAGGIGLGDMLYEQLKQSMEDASRVTSPSAAEDRKPVKELTAKYDPRMLNPEDEAPPAVSGADSENERLDAAALGDLYEPLDADAGGADAGGAEEQEAEGSAEERFLSGWDEDPFAGENAPSPAPSLDDESLAGEVAGVQGPELLDDPVQSVPASSEAVAAARENAAKLAIDPEVMAAVEALARRIAPNSSPVTKEQRHTRLTPPSVNSSVNPSMDAKAEPASARIPDGQQQQVHLLEGGIRRKQGAMENEGGHQPLRDVPGLRDAPPAEDPRRIQVSSQQISRAPSVEVAWGADAALGSEEPAPTQPMHWPVEGRVTSSYGWRRSPFTGERTFHEGIDLAANVGSPVKACWDGVVSYAGRKPGYGNVVVVDHPGGWQSVYGHNSGFSAKVGDTVKAGEEIASVGNTGRSTGPHVHFEIRHKGAAFDPMKIQNSLAAGRANVRQA